jgi:hypothetical protein
MNFKYFLLLILTIPFLSACETEEDRLLAEAEACINRASSGDVAAADACIAKVAGMENEDAYMIRCSAHFIAQDFNEARLADAFENIDANSNVGGFTPTTIALSYMVFNNALGAHTVTISKADCERSGATSLARILTLVEIGTTISDLGGGGVIPGDTTAIEAIIADLTDGTPATAPQQTAIGTMAVSLREDFCVNNSAYSSTDVCDKVNAAYTASAGNVQSFGAALLELLDNN